MLLVGVSSAYAAAPAVKSVSPVDGSTAGHTETLVKGEDLLPEGVEHCTHPATECATVEVHFGSAAATLLSGTQKQLKVLTPANPPGAADVSVTASRVTGGGATFTYLSPPAITITSPSAGSVTSGTTVSVAGEADRESNDPSTVTVILYRGSSVASELESHMVDASAGHWSTVFVALAPGTYTVRAEQRDTAGIVGLSAPVTFTLAPEEAQVAPPPSSPGTQSGDAPPEAAFSWFPSLPQAGELVTLVSSSRDSQSPITTFGWAFSTNAPFENGGPLVTASFATPGAHVVRLRVISADGLSSVATDTITVSEPHPPLMQPFPIVRILGSYGHFGAKIALLSVQAPTNATISVRCKGHGCPVKSARRTASANGEGANAVSFRRFERRLPAGVTLVVRVSAPGEIGKYTRFAIRRGKPPKRVDACLGPASPAPIACPTT